MSEIIIDNNTGSPHLALNKEEAKLLYNLLGHQFISYENPEVIQLVRTLREFANNELPD